MPQCLDPEPPLVGASDVLAREEELPTAKGLDRKHGLQIALSHRRWACLVPVSQALAADSFGRQQTLMNLAPVAFDRHTRDGGVASSMAAGDVGVVGEETDTPRHDGVRDLGSNTARLNEGHRMLIEEEETADWMAQIAQEWHEELADPQEDLYTLADGEPAD
jgi:hypothetical protein